MAHRRSLVESFLLYGTLAIGSLIMFYPFLFQLLASLGSSSDYYETLIVPIPTEWHLERYVRLFNDTVLYKLFLNTLFRTVWFVFMTGFLALMVGYIFSKLRFRGRNGVFLALLVLMMIPSTVTIIPTYLLFARWPLAGGNNWLGQGGHGMIDSWGALLVGGLFGYITLYCIFLMKQMLDSLPYDYEEAARMDGAGVFVRIFLIYMPMVKPILVAGAIITFVTVWSDYFWPMIAINHLDKQMIAAGVTMLLTKQFQTGQAPDYPAIFALATITMMPPILVYLWLQKYFVQAFAMTGVKG
ncbi:carbohydrate ABC transporter permease [Cohnella sp. GCM10012308]|uniref:carbohydrate ABC transporter permease n=1 Tax=Cohnella sp. GCM10012308 TaxID=3317329 RepID=UPI00361DA799